MSTIWSRLINLAGNITGTLPIANGGSGQVTANTALNAFLPTQTSNSGSSLVTDGTNTSWSPKLTTTLASANIFVGNVSNVATATAVTGDVTITNAGVTAIGTSKVTSAMIVDGTIVNADISASAAIAGSKITAATSAAVGTVSYEDTNTFVVSFTGPRSFNLTFAYARVGTQVTLSWNDAIGVASTSGAVISAAAASVPAGLRPARESYLPVWVQDIGAFLVGSLDVSTNGAMTITSTALAAF